MARSFLEDSTWYRAITLTERIASLRACQSKTLNYEANAELAGRRMQRWRSQLPFSASSYFAQRLAVDGISENELLHLLGEPIEAVRNRFSETPKWMVELAQAFSRPLSSYQI